MGGAKRVIKIYVGAPFHSRLMRGSAIEFQGYASGLAKYLCESPVKIVSDVDGKVVLPTEFAGQAGPHIGNRVNFVAAIKTIERIAAEEGAVTVAFGNSAATRAVSGWVKSTLGKDFELCQVNDYHSARETLERLAA